MHTTSGNTRRRVLDERRVSVFLNNHHNGVATDTSIHSWGLHSPYFRTILDLHFIELGNTECSVCQVFQQLATHLLSLRVVFLSLLLAFEVADNVVKGFLYILPRGNLAHQIVQREYCLFHIVLCLQGTQLCSGFLPFGEGCRGSCLSLPAVATRSRAVGTIIYKRGEQHPRLFALIVSREPLFVFEFEDALFAFE